MAKGNFIDNDNCNCLDTMCGHGGEQKNKRRGLIKLIRFRKKDQPGEYIELDHFGRGEQRCLGDSTQPYAQTQRESQNVLEGLQEEERKVKLPVVVFKSKVKAMKKKALRLAKRLSLAKRAERDNKDEGAPVDDNREEQSVAHEDDSPAEVDRVVEESGLNPDSAHGEKDSHCRDKAHKYYKMHAENFNKSPSSYLGNEITPGDRKGPSEEARRYLQMYSGRNTFVSSGVLRVGEGFANLLKDDPSTEISEGGIAVTNRHSEHTSDISEAPGPRRTPESAVEDRKGIENLMAEARGASIKNLGSTMELIMERLKKTIEKVVLPFISDDSASSTGTDSDAYTEKESRFSSFVTAISPEDIQLETCG